MIDISKKKQSSKSAIETIEEIEQNFINARNSYYGMVVKAAVLVLITLFFIVTAFIGGVPAVPILFGIIFSALAIFFAVRNKQDYEYAKEEKLKLLNKLEKEQKRKQQLEERAKKEKDSTQEKASVNINPLQGRYELIDIQGPGAEKLAKEYKKLGITPSIRISKNNSSVEDYKYYKIKRIVNPKDMTILTKNQTVTFPGESGVEPVTLQETVSKLNLNDDILTVEMPNGMIMMYKKVNPVQPVAETENNKHSGKTFGKVLGNFVLPVAGMILFDSIGFDD